MPASLRCLSLSLTLLLAACAATPSGPPSRTSGHRTEKSVSSATPINKSAPSHVTKGPARTLTIAPTPEPRDQAPRLAEKDLSPQPATEASRPIVLGAPLPIPKPFAPPQGGDPLAPSAARFASPGETGQAPASFGADMAAIPPASASGAAVAGMVTPDVPAGPEGFAAAQQQAGPLQGYAGIAWGNSAKTVPGLAVHEADTSVPVITYTWPAGPRDVMGAPIRDAYLEFFQDRFYHVWIDLDGMAAYKTALAGLTAAYGPPTSENTEKYYHTWTLGDVNVYCAFHPAENEGDVSYFYQPLYERLAAARKASRAKAPKSRRKKS